jgi:small ubiquitin-related modifier
MRQAQKAQANILTIRVRDGQGVQTYFKLKTCTRMKKVFNAYAERNSVRVDALRFWSSGGKRITEEQTPMLLGLKDQDIIDCDKAYGGKGSDDDTGKRVVSMMKMVRCEHYRVEHV